MKLKIGQVQLKTNLMLAPIAGYCDLAFRLIVRSIPEAAAGVGTLGIAFTDLLCSHAVLLDTDLANWRAKTCAADQPLGMQLYGADPGSMAAAAEWAAANGATIIDINMGCPVDKVTKKHGGSKLLCDPKLAVELAKQVVRAVSIPVTCKIRLGWDDTQIVGPTLAPALADVGVAAIIVHGRTTRQLFSGEARLEEIAKVVQSMQGFADVPVIGNGDVRRPEDVKRMMEVTGCEGVMIGRGALGQPWIFRDSAYYLEKGELPQSLTRLQRAEVVLEHYRKMLDMRGEVYAVNKMRARISRYSTYLQPWPHLRREVHTIKSAGAFDDYLAAGVERIAREEAENPELQVPRR